MEEEEKEEEIPARHVDLLDKIRRGSTKTINDFYIGMIYKVGNTNTGSELGVYYNTEESKFMLLLDMYNDSIICSFTDAKSYSILLKHLGVSC